MGMGSGEQHQHVGYVKKTSTHTSSIVATHQAASVDTQSSRLLVTGCAIEHTTKVVVEVVTQGQAA